MEVDYKELCQLLFGTTDVKELEVIAAKYRAKNDRGAGRKPKFSKTEIYFMNLLRNHGIPVQTIAKEFGTSRQTVYKYLDDSEKKTDLSFDEAIAVAEAEMEAGAESMDAKVVLEELRRKYFDQIPGENFSPG